MILSMKGRESSILNIREDDDIENIAKQLIDKLEILSDDRYFV
jgi:hypothetical protein